MKVIGFIGFFVVVGLFIVLPIMYIVARIWAKRSGGTTKERMDQISSKAVYLDPILLLQKIITGGKQKNNIDNQTKK